MKNYKDRNYSEQVLQELKERRAQLPKALFEIEEERSWGWDFYGVVTIVIDDTVMLKDPEECTVEEIFRKERIMKSWTASVKSSALTLYKWLAYKHWRIIMVGAKGERTCLLDVGKEIDISETDLQILIKEERDARKYEISEQRAKNKAQRERFLAEHPGYMKKKCEEYKAKARQSKPKKRMSKDEATALEKKLKNSGILK